MTDRYSLFLAAEDRLSKLNEVAITSLLKYRGVPVNVYRPERNTLDTRVYGAYGDDTQLWNPDRKPDYKCVILVYSDNFVSFDNGNVSLMTGGKVVTDFPLEAGDILEISRKDIKGRFLHIVKEVQFGTTQSVVRYFEFSSYNR